MGVLGVIIARFQSPYLHEGHRGLIDEALERHEELLILLGESPTTGTSDVDPLSFITRKRILLAYLKQTAPRCVIMPLKGRSDDRVWSTSIDSIIENMGYSMAFLYHGRDSFADHYFGKYATVEITPVESPSGTDIRTQLEQVGPEDEYLMPFAHGVIWAHGNRYPVNVPVVDIMVFKDEKEEEILLGRKAGETKWRFAGGYVDIGDESFEHAAARELGEEMGLYPGIDNMHYVMSIGIDDWRYKKSKDRMVSTVFKCYAHIGGLNQAKAGDDLEELKLFKIFNESGVNMLDGINGTTTMVDDHEMIMRKYYKTYEQDSSNT